MGGDFGTCDAVAVAVAVAVVAIPISVVIIASHRRRGQKLHLNHPRPLLSPLRPPRRLPEAHSHTLVHDVLDGPDGTTVDLGYAGAGDDLGVVICYGFQAIDEVNFGEGAGGEVQTKGGVEGEEESVVVGFGGGGGGGRGRGGWGDF